MAFDAFLKIESIDGESRDAKHPGWIDVLSFSWGETQAIDVSGGGGAGTGKVSMQDMHFVAATQKSSPKLFLACANGQHIKQAYLELRKSGGDPFTFVKWTLTDLLVTSYDTAGNPDGGTAVPTDSFSFNFAKIEFAYTEQSANGSPGTTISEGWDRKNNAGF